MSRYAQVQTRLQATPQTWLITGVAGFIGSHLLETLLQLDQRVTGLDNFATGHRHNLDQVRAVDPYYLTHQTIAIGHHPEIIRAGRHINDRMGAHAVIVFPSFQ